MCEKPDDWIDHLTRDELRAALRAAVSGLQFYAERANWQSPSRGFALQYDPEPAPAQDYGARARSALGRTD